MRGLSIADCNTLERLLQRSREPNILLERLVQGWRMELLSHPLLCQLADGSLSPQRVRSQSASDTSATSQTLYLDTGDPTIQSKMKRIGPETLRVTDTLGLKIGTDFDNLVKMKDLIVGNVGSMTNQRVTDLVTGDVRTFMDPKWQEEGTICIRQDLPYPASILAVIPQLAVGDSGRTGSEDMSVMIQRAPRARLSSLISSHIAPNLNEVDLRRFEHPSSYPGVALRD